MKITVLPGSRLTPGHIEVWSALQRSNPALDSPFFRPEFTQAVAAVRDDVEVAILEQGGEPVGFFPFHRRGWGIGKPIGGPMCDFQGVIARPELTWSPEALVSACGLATWDFDHLVTAQEPFRPYHYAVVDSPYMDLSQGFDAYFAERTRDSRTLKEIVRKRRKLERDHGEARLVYHSTDRSVFETLLTWKSEQYRRTQVTDVFAFPWTVRLLEQVLARQDEAFAGKLSALYVGGRLVAIQLAVQSFDVLHDWFPSYDREYSAHSPGLVMQLDLAREAAAQGVRRYDLGKGSGQYKATFATGAIPVAEGSVACGALRLIRRGLHGTRTWARSSRLGGPVRLVGRWTRSLRGWLAFR